MINSPITKIERRSAYVAAAVVDDKEEPAGQIGQPWRGAERGVEDGHHGSYVDRATADAGQWRRDDVAYSLVGLRRQKPGFPYRTNEAVRQRVRKAAKLQAGTGGELEVAAAELLRDPAHPAKRRTARLPARNPNPDDGPILCQMGPQHAWAPVRVVTPAIVSDLGLQAMAP